MSQKKILLLSLGGTITMTGGSGPGITPTLGADDLVRAVPGLDRVAALETASPFRVPGPSLSFADLTGVAALLEERLGGDCDGAVVVQGTDTIEETAFLFDLLVRSDKPVVVTGAMRGAETAGADGPANLLAAATVAAEPASRGLGTLVVLNDQVHAARFVRKSHTALPSAFASPLAGPLGLVAEGRATILMRPARTPQVPVAAGQSERPRVALVRIALDDDGRMLRALPTLGYAGAVLEAMGAGHVPAGVAPLVGELVAAMPVVLDTRVPSGPVFRSTYGYAGSETDLIARGAIPGGFLGGLKSRILLALLLGAGLDRPVIERTLRQYAG
jgi:L-asparaginase